MPAMIERARGEEGTGIRGQSWRSRPTVAVLIALGLSACAGKQPPPKTPAAVAPVAAPPAPGGVQVGPPLVLLPATAARPYLLANLSVGSFDRLITNGVTLVSSAVPLPITPAGAREMLFSDLGLPPEVAANLDLAGPTGAAVVALDDKGRSGMVLAVAARGTAEADKLIEALGKPAMTRGPATLVTSGGKPQGWVLRQGNVVIMSDEAEAIARGAALAQEARRAGPDDATATIYPEALARSHGTDVKTAVAQFIEQMKQAQQQSGALATPDSYLYETMGKMLDLVGDADRIEIGLSLDPARGLILNGRLMARPGSALEAAAREVHPFEIDPAVIGGTGVPFAVGASSIGSVWREVFTHFRARLATSKEKGAPAALAYYDAFIEGQGGLQSGIVSVGKQAPYFSGAFSTSLKDAAAAAKVSAAIGHMDAAAMAALMQAQFSTATPMFEWTAKHETAGKARAMHFRLSVKKGSALDTETMRKILGGGIDVYQAVAGNRVAVTFGRDAKVRLSAIAAGKTAAAAKTGSLAEAEAAAKGRDAFYYADLGPLLGMADLFGAAPRFSAMVKKGSGPIPMIVTTGGDGVGKRYTMDFTLPLAAFTSIGQLVTAGMAAGMGGPQP